jgi:trans-aconitate 2-methyltransferase
MLHSSFILHPSSFTMPQWDANQYLNYAGERTRPAVDLLARVSVQEPHSVVDLGCGPGNSTELLRRRWPAVDVVGVDSSPEMIEAARAAHPDWKWELGDIATWTPPAPYGVVFSNAALQWVPDHARVLPHLMFQVAPGGALAVQVPAHLNSPVHQAMLAIARDPAWRDRLVAATTAVHVETPSVYYDLLQPLSERIDLWVTEYQHVMDGPAAVVDWIRGTGLRPFLQALADDAERAEFERRLLAEAEKGYPRQADGRVLFPFRRLFLVAYRPAHQSV